MAPPTSAAAPMMAAFCVTRGMPPVLDDVVGWLVEPPVGAAVGAVVAGGRSSDAVPVDTGGRLVSASLSAPSVMVTGTMKDE